MESVPIERQLEVLDECGLGFVSDEAKAYWLNEWGRDALESNPFDLILESIGGEFEDKNGQWRPSGFGAWHLDTECICDADDYVKAVQRLANLTKGDVRVVSVKAHLEDTAWVRFEANDNPVRWELEVSDDWIDVSLIDRFDALLQNANSKRRFCAVESDSQDLTLTCPTRAEWSRLAVLSAKRFHPIGNPW